MSKARLSLNSIQTLISDCVDKFLSIHPVQIGSKRISKQNIFIELVHFSSFLNAYSMTMVPIIANL